MNETRLDTGTQLVLPAGWYATTYVEAGEAVLSLRGRRAQVSEEERRARARTRRRERAGIRRVCEAFGIEEPVSPAPLLASEENRKRAAARARSRLRRYCAHNGLSRLWSLTYAVGVYDPSRVKADVRVFVKRLREALGGVAFPYAYALEWHKSGHGLHVHMALGQFAPKETVARAWGHGFVDGRRITASKGSGGRANARAAARYLAKYVGKTYEEGSFGPRSHRYEVGQGFEARARLSYSRDEREVWGHVYALMDGEVPSYVWRSDDVEGWAAPAARVALWDG